DSSGEMFLLRPDTVPSELGLKRRQIDLLLASPECTNHTCAKGAATRCEESKRTANYVLNFTRDLAPQWVVIENVIHMKSWDGYNPLLEGLRNLGYGIRIENIDAVEFGVPQKRRRLFLLCEKGRIPASLPRPAVTSPSAWQVLDYDRTTKIDKWPSTLLDNGRRALPTLARFRRGVDVLGKEVPFLIVYYGSDGSGGWQSLDHPLRTITTIDRFGLVTWRDGAPWIRMLQVPELMRAMGIEDSDHFELLGSRRDRIRQIGNGVAPPVMQAIVQHLTKASTKRLSPLSPRLRTEVIA
ncbi:MAG: DNA cytosine methyltransferase, partial [Holophaga sp.]|nr:DNA cytosine methyltransferase [Holophaga sp.]